MKVAVEPFTPKRDSGASVPSVVRERKTVKLKANAAVFSPQNKSPTKTRPVLEKVVDPLLGASLPMDSPETALVLNSMFSLANANQQLFPATLPGTKVYSNTVKDLVAKQEDYLFTVVPGKAQRHFALIINLNVYLVNSRLYVTNVTKFFPEEFAREETNLTLIDGYLVDTLFLVSDVLAVSGQSVRPLPLLERLGAFEKGFGLFLSPLPKKYPVSDTMSFVAKYEVKPQNVAILRQQYYALKQLSLVLHAVSGLKDFDGPVRFVPRNQHYKLGLNKLVYSWRPVRFIFVDFAVRRVKCSDQTYFQLLKEENGHLVAHDYIANVKTDVWDGCVMECFWDPNAQTAVPKSDGSEEKRAGVWVMQRIRTDRLEPNPSWMVTKLMEEIDRNITAAQLVEYFGQNSRVKTTAVSESAKNSTKKTSGRRAKGTTPKRKPHRQTKKKGE